jgi:hypothetical protein
VVSKRSRGGRRRRKLTAVVGEEEGGADKEVAEQHVHGVRRC